MTEKNNLSATSSNKKSFQDDLKILKLVRAEKGRGM